MLCPPWQVNVSRAPPSLFYVSTMVKHAASGANAAFICIHNERVGRYKHTSHLTDQQACLTGNIMGVPVMDPVLLRTWALGLV